jgi:CheY-like chemotaxis protein
MDVQMPVMDGIEATRQLRLMPQFHDLPIVALTAGAFKSQQEAARAAGMTHFISKPFDVPTTVALIQRLRRNSVSANADDSNLDTAITDLSGVEPNSESLDLDVAAGLRIWSDIQTYRIYLRRFIDSYANVAEEIKFNLANGSRDAAMASVHKLAGVAANLALPNTHRLAKDAERVLVSGYDPTLILGRLGDALTQVMSAIDLFAPLANNPQPAPQAPFDIREVSVDIRVEIGKMLMELLRALDTDSPGPVQLILSRLEKQLPVQALATIRECVHNFDFRGAESSVRALATEFDISLENAS